ncbi:hypothetical protein G7081_01245 [Vagococcus coleopterorum]|uniref:Uncharacterized protein n=1 Tax=Vagococcus coleopterorum TaxID=2714946 RepID=A0A6G8ALF5_9ENTE|nr:hypothetical protein [Vagococcus coleopterorum]QIL45810.1 hypothetical protein G7081_01245 [Vagococcus coleopterorum]
MVDGRNESGFALITVLGLIIFISLMVGGVFYVARIVFNQVDKADQVKVMKDAEEYVMQDATDDIQRRMDEILSPKELKTVDFGDTPQKLGHLVDEKMPKNVGTKQSFGSEKQFASTVELKSIQKKKVKPYIMTASGWKKDPSANNPTAATNIELTFELETEIKETLKTGEVKEKQSTVDFVYEVQWNQIDIAEEFTELDVWRNIAYSHNLPNGARYLSGDEWVKKMVEFYNYGEETRKTFNYTEYNDNASYETGKDAQGYFDTTDGKFLDFSRTGKPVADLSLQGSLLLENGVKLQGKSTNSQNLLVNGTLGLRSKQNQENSISDLSIKAGRGIFVDLSDASGYLALNKVSTDAMGMLVNNTKKNNKKPGGFLFGEGQLSLSGSTGMKANNLNGYKSNPIKKNPVDNYWSEYQKGSLVIASSNFEAGSFDLGNNLMASSDAERKIDVAGNFLLTSAMINRQSERQNISYFDESKSVTTPYAPSKFILDGKNTKMVVAGKSFIDAPKTNRRDTPKKNSKDNSKYYGDSEDWNGIILKDRATLELGYTGVEPFNLDIEKDAQFSMKLLPDLLFFDDTFLFNSVSKKTLNGKVILNAYNQTDAENLKSELKRQAIPVAIVSKEDEAKNGEVTIVKPINSGGVESSQLISRTFSYVMDVDY